MTLKIISKVFASNNTTTNLVIGLSLVVILFLVYLKNNNFELFMITSTLPQLISNTYTTKSNITIPLLNNDVIQNSALVNFINRFIINKHQQNIYASTLVDRQNKINELSEQVISLINPSS